MSCLNRVTGAPPPPTPATGDTHDCRGLLYINSIFRRRGRGRDRERPGRVGFTGRGYVSEDTAATSPNVSTEYKRVSPHKTMATQVKCRQRKNETKSTRRTETKKPLRVQVTNKTNLYTSLFNSHCYNKYCTLTGRWLAALCSLPLPPAAPPPADLVIRPRPANAASGCKPPVTTVSDAPNFCWNLF